MLRIALKNVLARKGRLLLSSLAVIAGCAFLSGVFVFSDTINDTIQRVFATAYDKTDAYVRSANVIKSDFGGDQRGTIDESLIDQVSKVPGVKSAVGDIVATAVVTDKDGKVVGGGGPPQFGTVYSDAPSSPWKLKEGRAPQGDGEVVFDQRTLKLAGYHLGDNATITVSQAPKTFKIVGVVTFGSSDSGGGPTWVQFDLHTAETFLLDKPGQVSSINVVGDGSVSETVLSDRIQALFDKTQVEVLTGKEITKESQDSLAKSFSFFTTFLTIFAAISIFVGCFVIYNVFKISTAQRLRENALLRAIGARSSQVTFAQFVEALAVGVIGAVLGFAGGVGLAFGITSLLNASNNGPGDTNLTIEPRSFIITFVVGVLITLACATFPALRAGRVPPLAAMRDVAIDRSGTSRRRATVGIVSSAIAIIGIALGLVSSAGWLAPGVIGLFVAIIAFGPIVVAPISNFLTRPLTALRGVTGQVAGRNAARSPERTALTAAALGVGLALLVAVSTLGSSLQDSLRATFSKSFVGQIAVSPQTSNGGVLPVSIADDLGKLPEVDTAVGVSAGAFKIPSGSSDEQKGTRALTLDPIKGQKLIGLKFASGSWSAMHDDSILVSKDKADSDHLAVGSSFGIVLLDGSKATVTVGGIYTDKVFGDYLIDRKVFASQLPQFDFQVLAKAAPGVSIDTAYAAIKKVIDQYPTAKVQTRTQFIDAQVAQLDGILNFIYALLGMSVFIAVLGIVLTLLLGVYERRRELGLMRAIGTTRPQVRGSIRWEAVITAILGAMMGLGLGVILGWIVVRALKDQGLDHFSLAPVSLVVFAVLALVLSLLAALVPSRRAARAPILEAIATI
ncbi:MAG: transporter substrate-binding protein [Ilumatobacteraceae bacterium]|nr:transporter substrate-binding protein [Ilumatobacteraceae bacterium]